MNLNNRPFYELHLIFKSLISYRGVSLVGAETCDLEHFTWIIVSE